MKIDSKITRRSLLCAALPAGAALRLSAGTTCGPIGCTSQINFQQFAQQAFQTQRATEWCWAASISMIFAFYGHPVSQQRIVSEVYGAPVNMPAEYGALMASLLNRDWTDDRGNPFSAQLTGAYDPMAGVNAVNNDMLVRELDQSHPVLVGAGGHAMVLTLMAYSQTPYGVGQVAACGVFDPWPGRGARNLSQAEQIPAHLGGALQFVATASIS